ncbi:hypothetical protein PVAND_017566 [Polypedilum vanderplanki]|uniref:Uncharacterized protein n=1 Tax=Polypedilum vanderplanki TaxID=319348 RepID=A0A9J6BJE9_POLVA|nr:hypothetical protein PVAND_017566 [Polypedilum vanderplanki]
MSLKVIYVLISALFVISTAMPQMPFTGNNGNNPVDMAANAGVGIMQQGASYAQRGANAFAQAAKSFVPSG